VKKKMLSRNDGGYYGVPRDLSMARRNGKEKKRAEGGGSVRYCWQEH